MHHSLNMREGKERKKHQFINEPDDEITSIFTQLMNYAIVSKIESHTHTP